ncbi:MAG: hypothetical protein M1816_005289 [Peltula sp. TS41687]|nr:MAG: hypothetical protein M1816_005289 [Peltula sp. TS41687]
MKPPLADLSLSSKPENPPEQKPKSSTPRGKAVVAESWEEEELSSSEEEDEDEKEMLGSKLAPVTTTTTEREMPSAPPPTPVGPNVPSLGRGMAADTWYPEVYGVDGTGRSPTTTTTATTRSGEGAIRPEKTDAVARRMIAGALGVRPQKKTDDQKEYEKAVKEKEMKRRDKEREAREEASREAERAKNAIWED